MSSSRWLENFGRIRWNMKILHAPNNKHVHVTTYFWPNITTGRGEVICTSNIQHISQETHECGKPSGVQIFLVQVTVDKWPQDHYFSQKVLLVGTPTLKHIVRHIVWLFWYYYWLGISICLNYAHKLSTNFQCGNECMDNGYAHIVAISISDAI